MNNGTTGSEWALPAEAALRVDAVCDRFEAAWKAWAAAPSGPRPQIRDYLIGVGDDVRRELLRQLIRLDMSYRGRQGDGPRLEEYEAEFGDIGVLWSDAASTVPLPGPLANGRGRCATVGDSAAAACGDRYTVFEELGHGGMAEVFRAMDAAFGRTLAFKVLLAKHRDNPELVRRFVEEARIHARLTHPAIVPVHELGSLPDRRPFFTMKLVKGQTLAELLKQRGTPQDDLPRFLAVFEQVCQAMAYAHAAGVIHRDLKPANVMVGAFGEVQVMDWGLAKVLSEKEGAPAPDHSTEIGVVESPRDETGDASRPGSVMGTLAYMAPEQARGEVAQMDERADVFGLGAILCVILTGHPPYVAVTREALEGEAQRGDVAGACARLDGCGADAELVRLCKKCLAAERDERPRNAGVVAQAVAVYRLGVEQRLRAAEAQHAAAEARAEEAKATAAAERRLRRVTFGLAASVVAVVLVGGAGLWTWQEQRSLRQAEKDFQGRQNSANAEASLARLDELYARFMWAEAEALLERTETLVGPDGDAELRERIVAARRNTAFLKRLDEIRLEKSVVVDGKLNEAGALPKYQAVFEENGFDLLDGDRAQLVAQLNASPVRAYLLAALDDWAITEGLARQKEILAVTAAATGQSWRERLSSSWDDGDRLAALYVGIPDKERTPAIIGAVGRRLDQLERDGIRRLEAGVRQHPADFWLHFDLGVMGGTERADARVGACRAALALRPQTAVVFNNLGNALALRKEYDAAVAEYKEAIRLDPGYGPAHYNLGDVLRDKKEYDAAVGEYKEAIRLDPKFAPPHNGLGNVLYDRKEYDAAVAEFQAAIRLDPKYALPHHNLGIVLRDKKEYDSAVAEYKEAIRLDPKFATPHNNLGIALADRKEYAAAVAEFKVAIWLDPKDAKPHHNLGVVLYDRKEYDAAVAEFQEAIRLNTNYASARNYLGNALAERKEYAAAVAEFQAAIRLDPKFAHPHNGLGNVLAERKEYAAAVAEFQAAIRLDPKFAHPHNGLGNVLYDRKEYAAAVAEFQAAIRLDPNFALAYANLGLAYKQLGRFAEAVEAFRKADQLMPGHPGIQRALRDAEAWSALDQRLPVIRSGEDKPKTAVEAIQFATLAAQIYKKEYALAFRLFSDAFAVEPMLVQANRYKAARAAVQFAAGHDAHGVKLEMEEWYHLQKQARTWLAADLAALRKFAASAPAAQRQQARAYLGNWPEDSDLVPVRDPTWVKAMPDEERKAWEALWAEVAEILRNTEKRPDAANGEPRKASDDVPNDPTAHFDRGNAAWSAYRLNDAIAEFRKAIQLDPKNEQAHLDLANVLLDRGLGDEAMADCIHPSSRCSEDAGAGRSGQMPARSTLAVVRSSFAA
jgi:tetratricopeptide (TPR) repeat protein/tRNA A-37 threonylcarbamoyl transferase component Bud32